MKVLSVRTITANDLIQLPQTEILDTAKRQLREPLLAAFDIYKSNVYYGVVTETEVEHYQILYWYQQLLDLNEYAFTNVPTAVAKYVKR